MSLVFLLFLFSKAYLKNVASIAKKSIILSIISMYKRSSSAITGTEQGHLWKEGAYLIRVIIRTGVLIGKTGSREALIREGVLIGRNANHLMVPYIPNQGEVHQHSPVCFLLQAVNAWQELLSCQNLEVKIKVTQLQVVWQVMAWHGPFNRGGEKLVTSQ